MDDKLLSLNDLQFMTGGWSCEIWGGTFEEFWTPPQAGAMQGCGRHLSDGKTSFMEFMSIETDPDGITMYMLLGAPSKGDKKPIAFKLTSFHLDTALFENPDNEFPSRIAYVKELNGMSCWIEGIQDGKPLKDEFKFIRVS